MFRANKKTIHSVSKRVVAGAGWALLLLAAAVAARSAARADEPVYVERFERKLDALYDTGEFVGLSVAVVEDGETVLTSHYGRTVIGGGEPVGPDTVYRLASLSKGFTTTLLGQLVEEGRIDWDDPMVEHAPRFRLRTASASRATTVEHVASHRVGLLHHAYDNWLEHGETLPKLLDRTSRLDLICQPGECYGYQNISFALLGDVVASAEGRTYEEAMANRVFVPLGMRDASIGREPLMRSDSWARPHKRSSRRGAWRSFTPNENYYRVAPSGGLNASADDMTKWLNAQLGHAPHVISAGVRADIHAERVDTPRERAVYRWMRGRLNDADYALGWRVFDYAGERLIFHAGGVAGYRALVAFMPERDLGLVAMWNSESSRGWRIMPEFFDDALGLPEQDWMRIRPVLAESSGGSRTN